MNLLYLHFIFSSRFSYSPASLFSHTADLNCLLFFWDICSQMLFNLFALHCFVTFRYQKAWREYVKFRHLLANMPKPSFEDKRKLESKENKLQEMRTQSKMKRDVTVAVSSKGFHRTGIMCDIIQVGAVLN